MLDAIICYLLSLSFIENTFVWLLSLTASLFICYCIYYFISRVTYLRCALKWLAGDQVQLYKLPLSRFLTTITTNHKCRIVSDANYLTNHSSNSFQYLLDKYGLTNTVVSSALSRFHTPIKRSTSGCNTPSEYTLSATLELIIEVYAYFSYCSQPDLDQEELINW